MDATQSTFPAAGVVNSKMSEATKVVIGTVILTTAIVLAMIVWYLLL